MNKKEALQALIEFGYENNTLFEKVLLDAGITTSDTYTVSNRQEIDLVLVDVYVYLKSHPKIQDGRTKIEFTTAQLNSAINDILNRYDLSTTTLIGKGRGPNVSGKSIW